MCYTNMSGHSQPNLVITSSKSQHYFLRRSVQDNFHLPLDVYVEERRHSSRMSLINRSETEELASTELGRELRTRRFVRKSLICGISAIFAIQETPSQYKDPFKMLHHNHWGSPIGKVSKQHLHGGLLFCAPANPQPRSSLNSQVGQVLGTTVAMILKS